MMDIRIMTKGASGEYEAKYVNETSLLDWFKSHTDEEGNVTEDIVVYQQCEIDRKADRLAIVMTDFSIDRDQERIDPAGWDLKNYKSNPVILWGHDWSVPAIGHMSSIRKRKEDGALVGIPSFSPQEVDQFGWMIGEKLKRGDLNAGSVGFRSKKVEIVEDEKEDARLIHRKQELYEFSIVNIPSNTNAVTVQLEAKPEEEKLIDEIEIDIAQLKAEFEPIDTEAIIDDDNKETTETKLSYLDELFKENESSSPRAGQETTDLMHMFKDSDTKHTMEEFFNERNPNNRGT